MSDHDDRDEPAKSLSPGDHPKQADVRLEDGPENIPTQGEKTGGDTKATSKDSPEQYKPPTP